MCRLHFALALLLFPCGCQGEPAGGSPSATGSAAATVSASATAGASGDSQAEPTPATKPAGAHVSAAASAAPEIFAAAPTAAMKSAKAYLLEHKERLGVYFGLPEGWRYDDPSWLSITPRDLDSGGWFVALRLKDAGMSEVNEQRLLDRGPKATRLSDVTWGEWQQTVAGRKRWPARIRRGSGRDALSKHGELVAIAGEVAVPGTPAVGFVASWPKSRPELEATMIDIVRHLHRCKVEVGLGCVPEE